MGDNHMSRANRHKRWHRNGKQILRFGMHYADCRDEVSARIIRQALWCRGWLPAIVVWLAAALVWSVAQ
jgi:hypothetical protein